VQDRWGWELPGGLVDEDEEPEAAAVRELEDQTGCRPAQLERLISFEPVAEIADAERVVFVGRDAQHAEEPVRSDDIETVSWVPLASVPELIGTGQVWNSASVVGLLSVLAQGDGPPAGVWVLARTSQDWIWLLDRSASHVAL
jgi:8-oxo-dGDP phosphatase